MENKTKQTKQHISTRNYASNRSSLNSATKLLSPEKFSTNIKKTMQLARNSRRKLETIFVIHATFVVCYTSSQITIKLMSEAFGWDENNETATTLQGNCLRMDNHSIFSHLCVKRSRFVEQKACIFFPSRILNSCTILCHDEKKKCFIYFLATFFKCLTQFFPMPWISFSLPHNARLAMWYISLVQCSTMNSQNGFHL